MILVVLTGNKLNKMYLPDTIEGNYIVKDYRDNIIGNIYAEEGKWNFNTSTGYTCTSGTNTTSFVMELYSEALIKENRTGNNIYLYLYKTDMNGVAQKKIKATTINIGQTGEISYSSNLVKPNHARLSYIKGLWYIEAIDKASVYVNDRLVRRKRLDHGDNVFIYGLRFIIISDFILVQSVNAAASVGLSTSAFEEYLPISQELKPDLIGIESDFETYTHEEEFKRSPRFRSRIKPESIRITPPPARIQENTRPGILTIGPRLTMSITSIVGIITILNNIATGKATFSSSILSLIVSVVVLLSSFLWPILTNKWTKHEKRKNEIKRVKTYRKYLKKKEEDIQEIVELQKQILVENNISLEECQLIIYNKRRNLWEKTISDDDFLTVRLGIGKVKPEIKFEWSEDDFDIDDDSLKDELKDMINKYEFMENMPLNLSLVHNNITAVIGNYALLYRFMQSMLLQIMTQHIYSELKIVVFTDLDKVSDWDYIKFLPHCWDNQHEKRFIAATTEEKKQLSSYLDSIIGPRTQAGKEDSYKEFNTYYLIIVDNIDTSRDLSIINTICESPNNPGATLLIKNDRIANLPRKCTTFINITEETSGVFETNLTEENQKQFKADFNTTINVEECAQRLANIHITVPKEKYELPKSIGFMEMYEVGNVEQFNSPLRWRGNNPVVSLAVPIGIDQGGNIFYMDIHEKAYGPHGLVAGTTGSGKSEWLITYILSLAINFSPIELQFVLIDYKGGGLAGSFENPETGMELPHLVGTITNLDKSEIRRSLASLEAESKRRQRIFNEARDKLDDSSMDIYKYQQYYRKGLVDEPLSHLLIISDEFAELKSQEPEFLDSLVSIARVGRSLGIHLILATQKPSGIVTDQIWSNSRFKVCLRVQDKNDSRDMLKSEDAAYLKQTGSFYLQVGMNEVFMAGQSAYAGLKYQPTNIIKKKIDTAVEELDRNGSIVNTHAIIEENTNVEAHGEELLNIIKYLDDVSDRTHIHAKKLWLTAIPGIIYIEKLKKKYGFTREQYHPIPIIGEYDDPTGQKQDALCVDVSNSNMFIYGVAGSGKEMLLQTLIYSLMTSYTTQEINFYIADFGAETLGVFENAPHVGGVAFASEMDKFKDILKMFKKEYTRRRRNYREFGGAYDKNIKYGTTKDPIMMIIINGYEYLKEEYFDIKEEIEKYMLDSAKLGIIFVLSTVDKSSIRMRTLNSMNNIFLLHLNDEFDYREFFGTDAKGLIPKNEKGRGLFKRDGEVYEFQTATIVDEEEFQVKVKEICTKLDEYYTVKAAPIPKIPNPINIDVIDKNKLSPISVCAGYLKSTIDAAYINLQSNFTTLITATKKVNLNEYCSVFYDELDIIAQKSPVYIFDSNSSQKNLKFNNIKYYGTDSFKENLIAFADKIEQEYFKYDMSTDKKNYPIPNKYIVVFDSLDDLNKQLTEEEKIKVFNMIEHSEEMGICSFVYTELYAELKNSYREKLFNKLLSYGNGVFIDNSHDTQLFMDITSRDTKLKGAPADNEGFLVLNGKGYYAEMLRNTKIGSDKDEI